MGSWRLDARIPNAALAVALAGWLGGNLATCSTVLAQGLKSQANPSERLTQPGEKPAATVSLVIDFEDGFQKHYTRLPAIEKMTVLDVLEAARKHTHSLQFEYRGRDDTAFLTSLDGKKNQGGNGRNWIYYVNDDIGEKSFALARVDAGDTVFWRLEGSE